MKTILAIGSYTTPEAPGIRLAEIDTDAGTIRQTGLLDGVGNPIYFAVDCGRSLLYAVQSRTPDSGRATGGTVAAYRIAADKTLAPLDALSFDFTVPCHVSLSHDGKRLFFAEYAKAYAGAIALNADGTFDKGSVALAHHEGKGPNQARQESAHCHCTVETPDGQTLYVCDLGIDAVKAYAAAGPGLDPLPARDFRCPPGSGPRHLLFGADGRFAWLVYELGSAVQAFAVADGAITPLQDPLTMLPAGFNGQTKAAAIRVSPCGKWLLASNRGHDSIAAYRIAEDGRLFGGPVVSKLTGSFPRDFDFVAGTDCVAVCHKLSDEVCLYRFDGANGTLARLPGELKMPRPLALMQL